MSFGKSSGDQTPSPSNNPAGDQSNTPTNLGALQQNYGAAQQPAGNANPLSALGALFGLSRPPASNMLPTTPPVAPEEPQASPYLPPPAPPIQFPNLRPIVFPGLAFGPALPPSFGR
jgi:hypothetical protein